MLIDYQKLANEGMPADELASTFLNDYFEGERPSYPINVFQMLTEQNIIFLIRPFDNCDGVYLPAFGENDTSLVGINLNRPISRQRFSAAHELCHHLKDRNKQFACFSNPKSDIEKYAEDFASELLMPLE